MPKVLQNLFKMDCSVSVPKTGIFKINESNAYPPLCVLEISQIIEITVNVTNPKNPTLLPNQVLKSIICLVAAGKPAPN